MPSRGKYIVPHDACDPLACTFWGERYTPVLYFLLFWEGKKERSSRLKNPDRWKLLKTGQSQYKVLTTGTYKVLMTGILQTPYGR
jgi:hypothetical protein